MPLKLTHNRFIAAESRTYAIRLSQGERRLAAIMFTDMIGYTALGQRNESLSLVLVEEQRKLIRPILSRHNGREVKTMGDAFLVEFSNALDAIRCAYDIQRATREFNISLPEASRIHLRVGVHLGDVVESSGDISGDAVNVASRIESLADDGGVCLTHPVYEQVENKFELPLISLGEKSLKNVGKRVGVYKVEMPWEEGTESTALDKRRIAVLPFVNISPDPNDEYFADGLTEELITTMSKISGLKVIARTSVSRYKGGSKSIREIAGELLTGSILEGSARKVGDRIRVSAQLIDSQTSEHLWAESYDSELKDVFAIQTEISKTVAEALKVHLLPKDQMALEKERTVDTAAYTLYLKGRFLWNDRTKESVERALKYFESALQKDPTFAPAYSGLADCYNTLGSGLWMAPGSAYPLAWESGRRALELDGNLSEAHCSLGWTLLAHRWDFAGAETEFKHAIELRPNYATAYSWFSRLKFFLRNYEEAYSLGKRALELDPFSRTINTDLGAYLASLGRIDEAMEVFSRTIGLNPDYGGTHYWKSLVHLWRSEYDIGVEEARKAFEFDKSPLVEQFLAWACASAGKKDEAQRILHHLFHRKSSEYVSPVWIGLIELGLGRLEEGYKWMEESLPDRNQALLFFRAMPWFENFRTDLRWKQIDAKLGLPQGQ